MRSNIDAFFLAQKETFTPDERLLLECVTFEMVRAAGNIGVPISRGDAFASFEASVIRLIINSRGGV